MKILHVYSGIYTGGGIIKKMINLISNDVTNNHKLYFIWYEDPLNKRLDMISYLKKQHIEFNYSYSKSIWGNIPSLYKYLKTNKFDLIHFYTDNVMVLGKIVQKMGIKQKFVRSFEGAPMYSAFPQKQLINWALSSCKNFVSISEYVKQTYLSTYTSLKDTTQTVVYNTLVHKLQRHKSIEERDGIVCIGTLTDQKQFDLAIKVISILKTTYKMEMPLYILGEGKDKEKLKTLATDLHVEKLVHFEGVVDNPQPYYDKCKLFMHPAYNEGFGLVVLEAMAMELGVMVSNSGALPEIVENEKSGYILPLGKPEMWASKINDIYNNNALIEKMGKYAHMVVENNFSQINHIQGYINFYNQVIQQ